MDATAVAHVRRFNRTVTQRLGVLEDTYLSRSRPIGQARLLWEIGPDGVDVRDLRARLDLDSGYLSRLLRALEADGLVVVEPGTPDRRVRTAHLPPAGLAERGELARRSDAPAGGPVLPGRRRRGARPAVRRRTRPGSQHPGRDRGSHATRRAAAGRRAARRAGGLRCAEVPRRRSGGDQTDVGGAVGARARAGPAAARGAGAAGPRARRPAAAPGDPPVAGRGDRAVPVGRLPRGAGVQRRGLRPPPVRESALINPCGPTRYGTSVSWAGSRCAAAPTGSPSCTAATPSGRSARSGSRRN